MGSKSHISTTEIISEKGPSYFLFLWTIRGVLEKHGGSMQIDRNTNTIVLRIPQAKKAACCEELERMKDLVKLAIRFLPSHN